MHHAEVMMNHFVELFVPWLFLVPVRCVRLFAGCISLFFMACIALTGNYAYINHITAVPMIACFDDAFLCHLFSSAALDEARVADQVSGSGRSTFWSCFFSG